MCLLDCHGSLIFLLQHQGLAANAAGVHVVGANQEDDGVGELHASQSFPVVVFCSSFVAREVLFKLILSHELSAANGCIGPPGGCDVSGSTLGHCSVLVYMGSVGPLFSGQEYPGTA